MVIIYTLAHPITKEVRYVGKTCKTLKQRLWGHISSANHKATYHNLRWVKSLLNKGLEPVIEEVDTCEDSEYQDYEKYWIAQFRAWGFRLTNLTEGGEGTSGRVVKEETKAKMSRILKGRVISPEWKEKIRNSSLGRRHTSETKARMANSQRNRPSTSYGKVNRYNRSNTYKVYQLTLEGELVNTYDSLVSTYENTTFSRTGIGNCLHGLSKSSGGFIWTKELTTPLN